IEDRASHLPQAIDVGYDPADISKEWIEQVINSKIQRRIDGIKINPIPLSTTHPGKYLYVVSIPQSERAPHMAADKRFYKRYNFESIPMEEYEVRDVARRQASPHLRLLLNLNPATNPEVTTVEPTGLRGVFQDGTRRVSLQMRLLNSAPKPADYIVIRLFIDSRLNYRDTNYFQLGTGTWDVNGSSVTGVVLQQNWGQRPVWDGIALHIGAQNIEFPDQNATYVVAWRLDAPAMTAKEGGYLIHVQGTTVHLEEIEVHEMPLPHFVI
ncbi:MAG: ATP-binding protein, partial [Chloroflexota bacterium]|nr:ATP-binding protein [Chloroflexota bacterium]